MTNRCQEAPDFTLSPLPQNERNYRPIVFIPCCSEVYLLGPSGSVLQVDAPLQVPQRLRVGNPLDGRMVLSRDACRRMQEGVLKVPLIGEEKKSLGIPVEPTHIT